MKFNSNIVALFLTLFSLQTLKAQSFNAKPETWYVDAEKVPCDYYVNECFLVKQPGQADYEVYGDKIEGFEYEAGYKYTIVVKQTIKEPPIAAGESVFKYVLVKVVSKKSIAPIKTVVAPAVSNNNAGDKTKIFEINFETVPCDAPDTKACLLIKEKGKTEYEIFYGSIYGFNYQEGYNYTISVKETSNGNYYFVNEISKKLIKAQLLQNAALNSNNNNTTGVTKTQSGKIIQPTSIQTDSKLDGKWYLRKMKENDVSSIVTDDNVIWLDINTFNDRIDGYGSCNKFSAVVRSDLNTTFLVSKITAGGINCGNKKIENLLFQLLEQCNRFELKNGNLILSDQWNFLLGFTKNADSKEDISSTYTPPSIVKNDVTKYASSQSASSSNDGYIPPSANTIVTESNSTSYTTSTYSNTSVPAPTKIDYEKIEKEKAAALALQLEEEKKAEEIKLKKIAELKAKQEAELAALQQQLDEKKQKVAAELKAQAELKLKQEAELAALKKQQLEQEQKKAEEAALLAKKSELEKQTIAKQKEIDELKKQLAEQNTTQSYQNNNYTNNVSIDNKDANNENDNENNDVQYQKTSSQYEITKFKKNNTNDIPNPEFPLRPYYLDGNELLKLERSEANFAIKQKGVYRGQDKQVQVMKEESVLQFDKNNLPRFFISIEDSDVDPYDVIDLCKADRIGKGRRNFTYAGTKYGGRVKDVTGKLMQLDFKKIRKGLYEIIIEQSLEQGEYAFLPLFNNSNSITSTNSIKANCFGIVDFGK